VNSPAVDPEAEVFSCFAREAARWGLALDDRQLDGFREYLSRLCAWNRRFNLTRITAPAEVVGKHFLDSLSCVRVVDLRHAASLIDVGSGAGFPGMPLKIAFPHLRVVLLDATQKRLNFCASLAAALQLDGVETVHARAEEAARDPRFRERFDTVVSRAVARLALLAEWMLPFARPGGSCVALKGPEPGAELAEALPVIERFGGGTPSVHEFQLPICPVHRSLIALPKVGRTPPALPQRARQRRARRSVP
jgi:16S rRNA (guanine527-N7)-methyltransferase